MWRQAIDIWMQAPTSGLGQDAVIEIMIALLGVMMAVMAILAAFVTLIFAALGIFGYKSIEEKSIQAAEIKAAEVAEKKIQEAIESQRAREQAEALSALQPPSQNKKQPLKSAKSSKKTTDAGLRGSEENDN